MASILLTPPIDTDDVPVIVDNTYSSWDESLLCCVAALANTGGGHFIIGYPHGIADNKALAGSISSKAREVLGVGVSAEPMVFCSQDAVDVEVPSRDEPVIYSGQKFTAVKGYSY